MFTIKLSKLRQPVRLGCTEEERKRLQEVEIDVVMRITAPVAEDRLQCTVNYAEIVALLQDICARRSWALVETMTRDLAHEILERSIWIERVSVIVTKHALPQLDGVSVKFEASRDAAPA